MLELKDVIKHYEVGDLIVEALKGVTLSFRKNEFVSILGPSGCGKTTLLNIIGGLDRYTAGDIVINGVSTKLYNDSDWDTYRNHSIGFVFQSYNLIPHQTVLANVELALTLSGVDPKTRKERATAALERVGLGDQLKKLPAQLSGGQMQRVAIARAIVNDPEIILADEPTGALDTETSIQVMDILKELSQDKLVIMVTHNPELAQAYSSRIINLRDGLVKDDTNPFHVTLADKIEQPSSAGNDNAGLESKDEDPLNPNATKRSSKYANNKKKKPSMSFLTALSLSLKNLATKKARTILTSFAGSIGIIGIALILSLSSGFSTYIDNVQRDTLTNYPISLTKSTMNMQSFATSFMEAGQAENLTKFPDTVTVQPNTMIEGMLDTLSQTFGSNDLVAFKKYIDSNPDLFDPTKQDKISAISYSYNFGFDLYQKESNNSYRRINYMDTDVNTYLPDEIDPSVKRAFESVYGTFRSMMATGTWGEILGNNDLIELQYDLLDGETKKSSLPTQEGPNEDGTWPIMIVVDQYNRIPDYSLYMMGLLSDEEVKYMLTEMVYKMQDRQLGTNDADKKLKEIFGDDFKPYSKPITFDDLIGKEYEVLLKGQYYDIDENNSTSVLGKNYNAYKKSFEAVDLINGNVLDNDKDYRKPIKIKVCGILRLKEGTSAGALSQSIYYTPKFTEHLMDKTQTLPVVKDQMEYLDYDNGLGTVFSVISYNGENWFNPGDEKGSKALSATSTSLGLVDKNDPLSISIYPTSFENKDYVVEIINNYNKNLEDQSKKIQYTDYIGMMISSITEIIDAITYILIAFVSISLIVSSIMIGVITYISVLERTKEIGVLRAMGASKRDVARVFNAETVIIGFVSGMLGIIITILLNIPISLIIKALAGIGGVSTLPVAGGIALVLISVVLTLIAGIIPSGMASKKDPVIALRSE